MRLRGILTAVSGMVARASNQLSTVVVTLVATRFLDPAGFGVFALAAIATTLIRTLLHTGAFEYLLKAPDAQRCSRECLAANAILSVVLSLIVVAGVLIAQMFAGPSSVTMVMLALLPSNLISAVGAWREALVMRTGRLTLYYGLTMATEVVAAGVAIALFFLGMKVYALVWQVYCRNVLLLILYTQVKTERLPSRMDSGVLREVLGWSSSRYASTLLSFGSSYGADMALGIFLSPAATGLYRTSSRLITAVSDMFSQPTKLIAMTTFSSRSSKGQSSSETWPAMFAIVGIGGWAALAGIAAVSEQLVPLALGERWRAAAALVPILAVARAASLLDAVTGAVLVAYNHQHVLFRMQTIVSAAGLALLAASAPFGLLPAAIAVSAATVVSTSITAYLCVHLLEGSKRQFLRILLLVAIPVGATLAGALFAKHAALLEGFHPIVVLGCAIVGGLAAWAAALLVLRSQIMPLVAILQGEQPAPTPAVVEEFAEDFAIDHAAAETA